MTIRAAGTDSTKVYIPDNKPIANDMAKINRFEEINKVLKEALVDGKIAEIDSVSLETKTVEKIIKMLMQNAERENEITEEISKKIESLEFYKNSRGEILLKTNKPEIEKFLNNLPPEIKDDPKKVIEYLKQHPELKPSIEN